MLKDLQDALDVIEDAAFALERFHKSENVGSGWTTGVALDYLRGAHVQLSGAIGAVQRYDLENAVGNPVKVSLGRGRWTIRSTRFTG